jgi:pimeloyl-ACP methyl ester carboxylesterase
VAWIVGTVVLLLGCGVAYQAWWDAHARASLPIAGRLIDIGARRLHLVCAGQGSPLILLEATGPGTSGQYQAILPSLAARTRVCAYDRAGMGLSDPSPRAATAAALADDLASVLTAAELAPPYVLVAGSAGGLVVEHFARAHPGRVAGLVLLDALVGDVLERGAEGFARLATRACLARALSYVGALRLVDPLGLRARPVEDRLIELTYRRAVWDTICSLTRSFPESARQLHDLPPLRADLPLRVLVHERVGDLSGAGLEEDRAVEPLWQEAQARLAARSRARLVVAHGSGHLIAVERPELVVSSVLEILTETRKEAAAPP